MECQEIAKSIGWLGETWGFWIQTGAFLLSAGAGAYVIHHNGVLAKKRALIDLIIHQKSDEKLLAATQVVYRLHEDGKHLSALVGTDSEERRSILLVLNNQEFIATGIRMGAFDEKVYKQMQCSNVRKLWTTASGFVQELRKIDGRQTIFQDFEKLALKWDNNPIKKI
jgi:Domain of unknown function (DUF4760)